MASLRPATVHDLPGLYRVCLLTGAAGGDATDRHADPDLLGHVFAGPYLLHPGAVALVVQDEGGVAGYCVAAPDTAVFDDWMESTWLPPLRARYPRASGATERDAWLVGLLHEWPRTEEWLRTDHPAHLHVDLLPRLQGQGWGRRVVEGVLDGLADAAAAGVHLGVDASMTGARAFYERLGFTELRATDDTAWYGRRLPR